MHTNESLQKSIFRIAKMDCPCEANLIKMKLDGDSDVKHMEFDLTQRTMTLTHTGDIARIAKLLDSLNLDSSLLETFSTDAELSTESPLKQRNVLKTVLAINFAFFLIELFTGIFSSSMGLVADSLDMLADALVYGMSLMVVGAAVTRKKKVALASGILQMLLAGIGMLEVIRRFMGFEQLPEFHTMIGISLLALIANSICLWLLQRMQSTEAHMRASVIFSANDVIINLGVILAGVLVWWFNSLLPDLLVGICVFLIVMRGAIRILQLSR